MTKLGEIKLKKIQQLNTANSSPLIRKHKEVLNLMMRTLSLDNLRPHLDPVFEGVWLWRFGRLASAALRSLHAQSLLTVGGCNQMMSLYPVFYCSPAAVDAGFRPVEAKDAYEAEQIVQREHPGAVTASLSERVTNEEEIRRLFLAWLEKI